MKKRASQVSIIAGLILMLAVAVVAIVLINDVFTANKSFSEIENCRESVQLQSLANIRGLKTTQTASVLDCPTQYREITDPNPDVIKKRLAYDLSECWYKFHEGTKDVFPAQYGEQTYYCAICSVTEFSGSAAGLEIPYFTQYLNTQQAPITFGQGKTVREYIQSYTSESFEDEELTTITQTPSNQDETNTIDTQNAYAALFLYSNQGFSDYLDTAQVGVSAGSVIGGVISFVPQVRVARTAAYLFIGTLAGGTTGLLAGDYAPDQWQAATVLIPYDKEHLDALNCNELPITSDVRKQDTTPKTNPNPTS